MSRRTTKTSEDCEFCGESDNVELHHIVPHRYGGSNSNENKIPACEHCHHVLERTYDARFFDRIGARVGMTPNMMLDHIRELESLLEDASSRIDSMESMYKLKLERASGQQTLNGSTLTEREILEIRIDTLQKVRDAEFGIASPFPSWDKSDELKRYREHLEAEYNEEDRPNRRGEAYSR